MLSHGLSAAVADKRPIDQSRPHPATKTMHAGDTHLVSIVIDVQRVGILFHKLKT